MNPVDEFHSKMLPRHMAAEEAFVMGDPVPRMELWSRRDPVTLFGAIGMSESGWGQLAETFPWVSGRFSNASNYRIEIEQVVVSEDLAYVLWFERCDASVVGSPVEPITVRVTHIYRREDGEWKIVHRHGDNPAGDAGRCEPMVRGPGDCEEFDSPTGGRVTYWVRGTETGRALTVMESVVAPGEGPPLHVHLREDEFIYVLEGRLTIELAGDRRETPAGAFVFIPRGVRHAWQNTGSHDARFLFGFTPAAPGMEGFFERAAELPATMRLAEGFRRFAEEAGMEVVGSPLS